jgi:hypothetical protein
MTFKWSLRLLEYCLEHITSLLNYANPLPTDSYVLVMTERERLRFQMTARYRIFEKKFSAHSTFLG